MITLMIAIATVPVVALLPAISLRLLLNHCFSGDAPTPEQAPVSWRAAPSH